jgi:hypothetical protein
LNWLTEVAFTHGIVNDAVDFLPCLRRRAVALYWLAAIARTTMRSIACAIFLTTTLLWSRPADADLITIEPDAFAAGTNLTAATPGVLLWTARITGTTADPLSLSAVYAQHSSACDDDPAAFTRCFALTGTQGFSSNSNPEGDLFGSFNSARNPANCFSLLHDPNYGGSQDACGPNWAGFTALLIELSDPTTFLEIGGVWNSDYLELRAFDANFSRLSLPQMLTLDPAFPSRNVGTVSMTAPTATMKYVFAGSTEGGIALDRLTFNQVPEPSTLLLTMAGLVGFRRYLRQHTRSKSRMS